MAVNICIKKRFKDFTLNIDLVSEDNRIGILGESGSGKSMLLKMIAGVMTPDEGHIVVNNATFFDSRKKINLASRDRHVGYLFQNYALFPNMTVEKNIGIGIRCKKEERGRRAAELVEEYHLQGLEKRYPQTLSGGQQQRTALARMMGCKPDIILMDEPYSAMDGFLKKGLQQDMIDFLRSYGGDLIFVSHDPEEVYRFGRRIGIIHDGRLLQTDSREHIFEGPESVQAARLTGFDNIASGERVGSHEIFVPDWRMGLRTEASAPEGRFYAAVRSGDIGLARGEEENLFLVKVDACFETPDANQYFLRRPGAEKGLCLQLPKGRAIGNETKIYLPKDRIRLFGES